jgi:cob(I)alamin adenosyltransferase
MTPFFSRQGDDGYTGLLGKGRVPKFSARMEALGALDEATAVLGVSRNLSSAPEVQPLIVQVQRDLYAVMAETAATAETAERFRSIGSERVDWLEGQIESFEKQVKMPEEFIVPGATLSGGYMSVARTVVRRAERRLVELFHTGEVQNEHLVRYLNRLSSLCFVLELFENQHAGVDRPDLAKTDS